MRQITTDGNHHGRQPVGLRLQERERVEVFNAASARERLQCPAAMPCSVERQVNRRLTKGFRYASYKIDFVRLVAPLLNVDAARRRCQARRTPQKRPFDCISPE